MVKLNDKEIQDIIELEAITQADLELPRDAHSKFRFEIEESVEDLMQKMANPAKLHSPQERFVNENTGNVFFEGGGHLTQWEFEKLNEEVRESEGDYHLQDPRFHGEASWARVWRNEDGLKIETAWGGYVYDIRPNEDAKGCSVEFSGPVNALLNQNLLPEMTYIPHTLEGKFVDKDTGKDLTPYMSMPVYGECRAKKNEQVIEDSYGYEEKGNPQDGYGYNVNSKFNNEIPFLPQSKQERKQMKAFEDFKKGKMEKVAEWKKAIIAENISRIHGKISGAVIADDIAADKISGKENRTITPEVGAELAAKIRERKEHQN